MAITTPLAKYNIPTGSTPLTNAIQNAVVASGIFVCHLDAKTANDKPLDPYFVVRAADSFLVGSGEGTPVNDSTALSRRFPLRLPNGHAPAHFQVRMMCTGSSNPDTWPIIRAFVRMPKIKARGNEYTGGRTTPERLYPYDLDAVNFPPVVDSGQTPDFFDEYGFWVPAVKSADNALTHTFAALGLTARSGDDIADVWSISEPATFLCNGGEEGIVTVSTPAVGPTAVVLIANLLG